MMRGTGKLVNPEATQLTVTLTAPVSEWRTLHMQLSKEVWPSWQFGGMLRDLLDKTLARTDAEYEVGA